MLLKKSDQIEKFFVQNEAKKYKIFDSFSKCAQGMIVVSLWPTQKCRKTRSDIILVTNLLSESSEGAWLDQ